MSLVQSFYFVFLLVAPLADRAPQDVVLGSWEVMELLEVSEGATRPLDAQRVMRIVFEAGGKGRLGSAARADEPLEWLEISWSIDGSLRLLIQNLADDNSITFNCLFLADRAYLPEALKAAPADGTKQLFVLRRLPEER